MMDKSIAFWDHQFVVTSFSRSVLVVLGFSRERVAQLTDEDLQQIAQDLEGFYLEPDPNFLRALTDAAQAHCTAKWPTATDIVVFQEDNTGGDDE